MVKHIPAVLHIEMLVRSAKSVFVWTPLQLCICEFKYLRQRAVSVPAVCMLRGCSEPGQRVPKGSRLCTKRCPGRLGLPRRPHRFGLSELGPPLTSVADLTGQIHISTKQPLSCYHCINVFRIWHSCIYARFFPGQTANMHFVETNLLIFKLPGATIRNGWQMLVVAGPEHLG